MKVGDQVKITVVSQWYGMTGEIIEVDEKPLTEYPYLIQFENDSCWFGPEELKLQVPVEWKP